MTPVHNFNFKVHRESRERFQICESCSKSSTFSAKGCRFSAVHTDFRYCKAVKQDLGQAGRQGKAGQEDKKQPWMLRPTHLLSGNKGSKILDPLLPGIKVSWLSLGSFGLGEGKSGWSAWWSIPGWWQCGGGTAPSLPPPGPRIDRRSQPTATLHCLLLLPRPSVP